jgi:hypothetical protein
MATDFGRVVMADPCWLDRAMRFSAGGR